MLFNSIEFLVFFLIVYGLYLFLNYKAQNVMLLIASYVFYGWWDWRFLFLMLLSTLVDYFVGQCIAKTDVDSSRKKYLIISVITNLGILGFFKYFNFFIGSMEVLLQTFGLPSWGARLNVILPVGISFYTFQSMSYTIDIYRRKIQPERHFLTFALFVSFFPQLVAGPIERAGHLLGQFSKARVITRKKFFDGCHLIFWGIFLKMFVADNMAKIVDPIYSMEAPYVGSHVLLATYAFSYQIFCDFAGYSSIARGLALCMGIDLMLNFNLPYFAKNPQDFWRRWHISLSTWLRDYLYIPLGGNRRGVSNMYRNLFLTMLLGGLWHGAAWNFIAWGAYHGLLLILYKSIKSSKDNSRLPKTVLIKNFLGLIKMIIFFHLVCIGWVFFRAQGSMQQSIQMFHSVIFNFTSLWTPEVIEMARQLNFFVIFLLIIQCIQYLKNDLMIVRGWSKYGKITFYATCSLLLVLYGSKAGEEFIYFAF